MCERPPPDLLQKRRPSGHSPRLSKTLIFIGVYESDELRTEVEVVVMKFIKDMQYRSLSFGEGEGG
jgi:hypothetical protein